MKYLIVRADLKRDKTEVLTLWERNFPRIPKERYRWIYENNPSGFVVCWLAKAIENGSSIGANTLFPRKFLINGKYIRAGIDGDFSVNKDHRGLGSALLLQKSAISDCKEGGEFDILYSFPNKQSEPVLKKAGYRVLGKVLRMAKPLRSYYQLKKYIDIPIITKILSKSIDLVLEFLSKGRYYKNTNVYSYEVLLSFDERFDRLWERVSAQFPIIGERSSSYLNWRYTCSPHKTHHVFALTKNENRDIFGYIVFHKNENKVYIDDLLCLDLSKTIEFLLSSFLQYQRRESIDSISISFIGTQALINKLKKFGFSLRNSEREVVVYSSDIKLFQYLLEPENWYLMPGDNDI